MMVDTGSRVKWNNVAVCNGELRLSIDSRFPLFGDARDGGTVRISALLSMQFMNRIEYLCSISSSE